MKPLGVVAAGHEETARAAELMLREGGNAFDAIVAAHFAACVAEPVLASLGGGGFLLAHTAAGTTEVYDFFVQTPGRQRPVDDMDFQPIAADFGTAQQEFHIGLGAIATPGTLKGLFAVQRELCSMPMARLMEPAVQLARDGVCVNGLQAYILQIVSPIYSATAGARDIFAGRRTSGGLIGEGEVLRQPQLADSLEALAREGDALFYEGEIADLISTACAQGGGHLSAADLSAYKVIKRPPLEIAYRDTRVLTNPPPSSGGILIAFALKLLEDAAPDRVDFGTAAYLDLLACTMELTNKARLDAHLEEAIHPDAERLLDADYLALYKEQIHGRAQCLRGTTQVSVIDKQGNIASLTVSNGEGCGHIVPGTGIMLNNMLGEEDLNPQGFHRWPLNQRMTSMMSPSLVLQPEGRSIALGSGGSNRIRSAILQVLINLIDFGMPPEEAVNRPRVHFEAGLLNVEGGLDALEVKKLLERYPRHKIWETHNLFFGGAHTVMHDAGQFTGAGDPRRGGVCLAVG